MGICPSVGRRDPARTGNPDAAFHSGVPESIPRRTAADPLAHGAQRRIVVARRGMAARHAVRTESGHDGDDLGRPSDGRGAAGGWSFVRGGRLSGCSDLHADP
jgi:hypothetical protein